MHGRSLESSHAPAHASLVALLSACVRERAPLPNRVLNSPPGRSGCARRYLRRVTRETHDRLELRTPLAALFAPGGRYSRDLHGDILRRLLSLYRPVEQRLWDHSLFHGGGFARSLRRKVPLLERDLRVLGHDPDGVPDLAPVPTLTTEAAALGSLYVIEGSTLGGKMIAKELRAQLQLTEAMGAAFFVPYGSATGKVWSEFLLLLEEAAEPMRLTEIGEGALAMFQAFEACLLDGAAYG